MNRNWPVNCKVKIGSWFDLLLRNSYSQKIFLDLHFITEQFNIDEFLHWLFHIFVPEAVDQWVQHGDDQGVKDRGHLDHEPWTSGVRNTVKEKDGPGEDRNGGQVGGTGGEGFVAPPPQLKATSGQW